MHRWPLSSPHARRAHFLMMMAHDSGRTPPPALSTETIERVSLQLAAYVSAPRGEGETLRAALHAMAREARSIEMAPEQLLVVLKDIWYAIPSVRGAEH